MTFAGITLTEWGPEALCALFVISVMVGLLVPRWVLKELTKRLEALEEALRESNAQKNELLEVTKLARATWEAAQRANAIAEGDRTPGVTG